MSKLTTQAGHYLRYFSLELPSRAVGTAGNEAAVGFFAQTSAAHGWAVETPAFDCLAWSAQGAALAVGGQPFAVHPGPYSPAARVAGPLRFAETVEALEALGGGGAAGQVLLLRGPLAAEPLMPRNFPFYRPDEHQRIYRALDASGAPAVVTASAPNPAMAGALYPYPMFEDGDFDLPSAYLTAEAGEQLAALAGQPAVLEVQAERRPAHGRNAVARLGSPGAAQVVVIAHIDAKPGTPGALDNASGVVVLLLLGQLLAAAPKGGPRVELVAMNGEDNYAAPGEQLYLRHNPDGFARMALGINLDGLGYREGRTAYSLYNCLPALETAIKTAFAPYAGLAPGDPWYQGDHMLWLQAGRPALALTSDAAPELMREIIHTSADLPDLVAPEKLVEAAQALRALITSIPGTTDH
jgi:aminopeptidase YwaD